MKPRILGVLTGMVLVFLSCQNPVQLEKTYRISYYGNGNTSGSVPIDQTAYKAGSVAAALEPGGLVRTNWTFSGWNTQPDQKGTDFPVGAKITVGTSNLSLFACWTPVPTYRVFYDGNQNTAGVPPVDPKSYIAGTNATVLGSPGGLLRIGYHFERWDSQADGKGTAYAAGSSLPVPAGGLTLYAVWTKYPVVRYHGNGATAGSVPDDTLGDHPGYGISLAKNPGQLARDGMSLVGWMTSQDGTGTSYFLGQPIAASASEMTLFAIWAPDYLVVDNRYSWITVTGYQASLPASVVIPNGIQAIGDQAFSAARALTEITISASVVRIGANPFMGCSGLNQIQVDNKNSQFKAVDGFLFNGDGDYLLAAPVAGISGAYQVPSSVGKIASFAFYQCQGMTSLVLPSSVVEVGNSAFSECSGLRTVTLENGLIQIPQYLFFQCHQLKSVTIPNSVSGIGYWAFWGCGSLQNVSLPASVAKIADGAFAQCQYLTTITVDPQNAYYQSIDGVLLSSDGTVLVQVPGGRSGLYTVPDTVTALGNSSFRNCDYLTSVTLPQGLLSIGFDVFAASDSLKALDIPASVTSMGVNAFESCSQLGDLYLRSTVPPAFSYHLGWETLDIDVFRYTKPGLLLHVPVESQDAYKSAKVWGKYSGSIVAP